MEPQVLLQPFNFCAQSSLDAEVAECAQNTIYAITSVESMSVDSSGVSDG